MKISPYHDTSIVYQLHLQGSTLPISATLEMISPVSVMQIWSVSD